MRRNAELAIPGWGRVEIKRGAGSGDLDQIERELQEREDAFANAVTPLGVSATDANALDVLMHRAAEHRQRLPEVDRKIKELKRLAPKGLNPLQTKVVELQTKLADSQAKVRADGEPLPEDSGDLERLAGNLKEFVDASDAESQGVESELKEKQKDSETARREETDMREELATCKARADSSRAELARLRPENDILRRIEDAARALREAEELLAQTVLTAGERTIDDRLSAAEEAVKALNRQIRDNEEKYNRIKGRLEGSEGLHTERAALAARADELTRVTGRESLEKDAVDRLYEIFEACREKRLGTLMGPICERVLSWMRVLDLGDYNEVRFSEVFLPEKLVRRDGTAEFAIEEESTGSQEQIGMLVRLALGSLLTSANEPAVAILDDPLTHCDVGRLNKMRAILRRAAEGDPNLTPPAGPLQIIILTCHPEWFRDERATVIDLENGDVMYALSGLDMGGLSG